MTNDLDKTVPESGRGDYEVGWLPEESEADVSITHEEQRMLEESCARLGLNDSWKEAGHE
jgi:hypothetical protein